MVGGMSEKETSTRVFIGGIGGGIGSALAERLLADGWSVGGFGRPGEHLEAARERLEGAWIAEADGTDSEAVKDVVKAFVEEAGGIDSYVHAVGNVFLKPLHMMKDAEWREVLSINLDSAFYATRAVVPVMRKQKAGSIVLFSSVAAVSGLANHEAIAAAKGGIAGLAMSIAATYAPNGLRANAIAPGLVETPATASLTGNAEARKFSERMHPVGRLGKPAELASLAAWLVSEDGSWVTGQVISMDGGMGAIVPKPRA